MRAAGRRRLQHVETLDDQDVGPAHDDLGARHDVVDQVRVDGARTSAAPLFTCDTKRGQRAAVVRLGEALALHQAAALELGVRPEEPVGGDQLDAGRVVPAAQQLVQQARGRRLADGDRPGDADHERGGLRLLAQEGAAWHPDVACGAGDVEVEQAAAAAGRPRRPRSGRAGRRGRAAAASSVSSSGDRHARAPGRPSRRGRSRRTGWGPDTAASLARRGGAQPRPPRIDPMCGIVGYVGPNSSHRRAARAA